MQYNVREVKQMKTLFEKFEVLEDPRDIRGKRYKLIDILIMTIYGILCGLTDQMCIRDRSRDWLKFIKSSTAKNKILAWFKKNEREDNIEKGKELIEKEIKKIGMSHSDLFPNYVQAALDLSLIHIQMCIRDRVNIEAEITGISKIDAGVGEINIKLLGNKEDYRINTETGIGSITIDNKKYYNNASFGTGINTIRVSGGIGNVKVDF